MKRHSVNRELRGVNLGGWLVLEPWITPSLFKQTTANDEYGFCQQSTPKQRQALQVHRDTYITEADFAWLASRHVSVVRLPVGYWLHGDEPYESTSAYVDKAFTWAARHGLKILLDLHGAPGSQNGEMHSGQAGQMLWHSNRQNIDKTLQILETIAQTYGQHEALWGIEVLNEPSAKIPIAVLRDFYGQAYARLKPLLDPEVWIICSDGFRPWRWWLKFPVKKYPGIMFDYHHYQIFGSIDERFPVRVQLWRARWVLPLKLKLMQIRHPLIVGEWSGVFREEKLQQFSSTARNELQSYYVQLQQRAFDRAGVSNFYWAYKTEGRGWWNFRANNKQIL